jgi:thiamine biosynthesis lipoprotein
MPRIPALTALLACVAVATAPSTGGLAGGDPDDLVRIERSDEAMGSWFALVLHGPARAKLEAAAEAAFEEVHRLDRLLSNYRVASEWSGVNRDAASRPVRVSAELFGVLSACLEYSRQSEGAFDITVGPLVKLWGFYKGEGALPRGPAVSDALGHVGYRHVLLEAGDGTVRFLRPGIELDPGGIGKGYAVDRMVAVLRDHGVGIALVSAAGSSIYGLGAPPDEPRGWRVSISAPGDPSRSVAEVHLEDLSVSTSGSYEKLFRAEGRTYSHIIDPRTGYPARGASSVSVVAARAMDSEAWTKPYFINGRPWTVANRRRDQRVFFCDDAPDIACAWIQ